MPQKLVKVLWLCPNLNHYKYKFLNHLNSFSEIEVTILMGSGRKASGDIKMLLELPIEVIDVNVPKAFFGFSKKVRRILNDIFLEFDYVMIPRERKNIVLILYFYFISKNTHTKLFSYNHPISYSGFNFNILDQYITKFLHSLYNKIIFYTEKSMEKAVNLKVIKPSKAFFANNTIFTKEIEQTYNFTLPDSNTINLLFIGRLIENKNLKILFDYFYKLKTVLKKNNKIIELVIIGDGPLSKIVIENTKKDNNIKWVGALESEMEIMPHMKNANFVFNPGHTGLHIIHALSYGRPYITILRPNHAPEIEYLKDGINGFLLEGDESKDIDKLISIFLNSSDKIYHNAFSDSKEFSIDKWCNLVISALRD